MSKRPRDGADSDIGPTEGHVAVNNDDIRDLNSTLDSTVPNSSYHPPSKRYDVLRPVKLMCRLPPQCANRPTKFQTHAEFEEHYRRYHSFTCLECGRGFPSNKILTVHITENHDPLAMVRRDRGDKICVNQYECIVEECDKVCSTRAKRRRHVIDKHGYPDQFDFSIIDRGLRRNQVSLLKTPRREQVPELEQPDGLSASQSQETQSMQNDEPSTSMAPSN